ncbi:antibiotic biosynthesis monooxygenase [Brenneria sp. 4F2]|nr:antibiotic biosynthesis monooxygenase [Brenneria bubanii]
MSDANFAHLPEPPYFAVVFSSQRTPGDGGYNQMASRMAELAMVQPGYLGVESARDQQGFGITVSYWDSLDAITQWKRHAEHRIAQEFGISEWYQHYELRIAEVKRAYGKRKD